MYVRKLSPCFHSYLPNGHSPLSSQRALAKYFVQLSTCPRREGRLIQILYPDVIVQIQSPNTMISYLSSFLAFIFIFFFFSFQ